MKFLYLLIYFLLCFKFSFTQNLNQNPFATIISGLNKNKPTIIYIFASWCSATIEDYPPVADTLSLNRDKFNLVIFEDTTSSIYKNLANKTFLSKADKLVSIAEFYPSRLRKLSENKKITAHFNKNFNTHIYRLGPGSMIVLDKKGNFLTTILNVE